MSIETLAVVIAAVFLSAFVRGLAGFGFALAAVPAVSFFAPPLEAVALAVMLQLIVGLRDVVTLRGSLHLPSLARLAIGSLIGIPIGIAALAGLSPNAARILIAFAVLSGLGLILRRRPAGTAPHPGLALGAGVASGVFSGLAAMPGPPAVAYYLTTGLAPVQTRATLLVFFCFTSAMAMPGLVLAGAIDRQSLMLTALSLPAMLIGTWAGMAAFRRLDHAQYRRLAIAVMACSALFAGARGLAGLI
ncbi:sulfite exporter TauE/SafE family protein [Acidimangrovimonas sediminis]|uniref:sulfite exporter TauE/SafE family protein n=1 Tax=Acidimangrovimonas sediminis TaxID=2056283 RepID=UPI000C8066BB|nr:sulfite exporter TauE/SafE family protein [Acidimangrovimonas sediminis]